jgi:hypothetical protein
VATLDRGRDLRGWLTTPLVTVVLAPALAISIGVLVAESSTSYPGFCDASVSTNGCEESVFAMFVLHARIFLAGWLLLWALPWWRGLRAARIAVAAVIGAVLLAAPLRLVDWGTVFEDRGRSTNAYLAALVLMIGAPIVGIIWSASIGRRGLAAAFVVLAIFMGLPIYALASHYAGNDRPVPQSVPGANPPCAMHSGSHDICPGG